MDLSQLQCGETAIINSLSDLPPAYRQKLQALGLTCNTPIRLIRRAPLGCPLQIEVRGVYLTVRRDEIKDLKIRSLDSCPA